MKITINNQIINAESGKTILEIARENGIDIPSLCHDDRLAPFGSCGICTVEIENSPRLFRACSTVANDGMVVLTDTERVRRNRKTALELILSDHCGDCKPPCSLACPAETDCMGYARLIADGECDKAYGLIREKVPFPASIGRVCPRPCEKDCRRGLVDEPISLASLKRFAGDNVKNGEVPKPQKSTGKSVGIVGGGPAGLSAAYYLRLKGHNVTVLEEQPEMGGMLRYGIPEYRLPKAVLKKEIDIIEKSGVAFKNNTKAAFGDLVGKYDALIVAIGAWNSSNMRCKGEDSDNVVNGIDFLYGYAIGKPVDVKGKSVAIVGGGNTAMDASRTALRLGAEKSYIIYRRTRDEMPAAADEIHEAEEEGVIFKFLTNPIEIQNGAVRLQIMKLGEPDSSGRRSPVAVEGEEETLDVDIVVPAIGQKAKLDGFGELETTKWGTILAAKNTFRAKADNADNVFAIGDATNNGADIAVSAIGEGRKCAESVDRFLNGAGDEAELIQSETYLVKSEKTAADFADIEKQPRCPETVMSADASRKEAGRCLECGCAAYHDCKLIKYANEYGVQPERFSGERNTISVSKEDHDKIIRNPEKCVLCGLCVRVCDEIEGATALGFSGRGFKTEVKPALDFLLKDTTCNSCGKCAEVCPTGAIISKTG